jgi:FkbM family methyltransferase
MLIPTKYGFSIEVNPESYFAQHVSESGGYEEAESRLILSMIGPGDICVDAGANVGYFSMLMASKGATVIAIEPNPEIIPILARNLDRCQVSTTLFPHALHEVDSTADFYMPSDFDDGWGSLAAADRGDLSRKITVSTRRLDTLLDFRPQLKIKLLKLDVEGAEVPALRGLGDMRECVEHILVECIDIPSRTARIASTVNGINVLLAGWNVKRYKLGQWVTVDKAVDSGENFLFTNPKAPL